MCCFPTPSPCWRRCPYSCPYVTGCGWPDYPPGRRSTTYQDACSALWLVCVKGWTQTRAANALGLNQGTVSRIVRGLLFRNAFPIPLHGFGRMKSVQRYQSDFGF